MRLLQVGELTSLIRAALEEVPDLQDVYVEAEIGDCSRSAAGHWYLTLKDARPQHGERFSVQAVMFRSPARSLRFEPRSGQQVIAHGAVSLYPSRGSLQLYLESLEPRGVGALALAFQQLVAKLEAEGLFRPERKRPLPFLPRRVAVVTSTQGAAIRDVVHVIQRRCPITQLLVVPALVQGDAAVASLSKAMRLASRAEVDLVLLVRGGGSMEDLQAFNSEALVREVVACPHPVVTGVGHETDTTVVDFVADRRAATPSAAAEQSVPELSQLRVEVSQRLALLQRAAGGRLAARRELLLGRERRLQRMAPAARLATGRLDLDRRARQLNSQLRRRLEAESGRVDQRRHLLSAGGPGPRLLRAREEFRGRLLRLEALSPLAVLARGYSITFAGGRIVREASEVAAGEEISTRVGRGRLRSRITMVEPEET